jgi:hypothetical protein
MSAADDKPTMNNGDTPMNAKPTKETAVDAYTREHLHAVELLERIHDLLHDRPAPDDHENQIKWGHVGDTNHVNQKLSEIVAFLSGTEK